MDRKIAFITASDLSTVQGSTEAYYVLNDFGDEYDVHTYSPIDPDLLNVTYHSIPDSDIIPSYFLYNIVLLPLFIYETWKQDYDIIYSYKSFSIPPFIISVIFGTPWIADLQTKPTSQSKELSNQTGINELINQLYYRIQDHIYQMTLPRATAIITLSCEIKEHLIDQFGVDESIIYIVPLGVDTDEFKRDEKIDKNEEQLNIVYIGSIRQHRDFMTCLEALSMLQETNHTVLHMIGDGPGRFLQELESKSFQYGVEDQLILHGYVDHHRIPEILSFMDAAISPLPDIDSYEVSSPAKIYEYLAMELPVLCTDIKAHRKILQNKKTGFFYQPGDPASLAEAMREIQKLDENQWETVRTEARQKAIENDWTTRLQSIRAVVETV